MAGGVDSGQAEVRALTDSWVEVCPDGIRWMGTKAPGPRPPAGIILDKQHNCVCTWLCYHGNRLIITVDFCVYLSAQSPGFTLSDSETTDTVSQSIS